MIKLNNNLYTVKSNNPYSNITFLLFVLIFQLVLLLIYKMLFQYSPFFTKYTYFVYNISLVFAKYLFNANNKF